MKTKFTLLLFFIALIGFAQVTVEITDSNFNPINEITVCDVLNITLVGNVENIQPNTTITYQWMTQSNGNIVSNSEILLLANYTNNQEVVELLITSYDVLGNILELVSDSINITVNNTPNIAFMPDIFACDSYVLPTITGTNLSGNEAYYTTTNGSGTVFFAGDIIDNNTSASFPITLYVYGDTGTTPNCSNENSFIITIEPFDDASFQYENTIYTIDDVNPIPTITTTGGIFTIDNGGTIDAFTGEIDLATTTEGIYTITYTTSGQCTGSSTFTIEVVVAPIIYLDSTVAINGVNPIPTILISGGTFDINNSASINTTTGEVDLTSTVINTTYTINYNYTNTRTNTNSLYTFELTVVETLSITNELLSKNISIYPNPVKNNFTVKNKSNVILEKLEITDYLGKLIKTVDLKNMQTEQQISIKDLNTGVYFIKMNSNNNHITKKLIVK